MSQPVSDARFCASRSRRCGSSLRYRAAASHEASALPLVTQHVAALEVRAIGGLLEHEVFGKVRGVVADVQPRHEDVLRTRTIGVG